MSISANKVPGARAALVVDASIAALCRSITTSTSFAWGQNHPGGTGRKILDTSYPPI